MCELDHGCPHYDANNPYGCKNCEYLKKYKRNTRNARIALVVCLALYIIITIAIFG